MCSINDTNGQVLIFRKSKKEFRVYPLQTLTIVLNSGAKYKGAIDSVNANSIFINTPDSGYVRVDVKLVSNKAKKTMDYKPD
jgi:hypothetical protein